MCYKCCNTLITDLLDMVTEYKRENNSFMLVLIMSAIDLLQQKMMETVTVSLISGIDYVRRVELHSMIALLQVFDEIDISKELIDTDLFEMFTELVADVS